MDKLIIIGVILITSGLLIAGTSISVGVLFMPPFFSSLETIAVIICLIPLVGGAWLIQIVLVMRAWREISDRRG